MLLIIQWIGNILILLIFINSILSFILPPYHQLRMTLDRFVEPMLRPIRQVLPSTGMVDFSPFVLIIIIYLLQAVLTSIILRLV